MNNPKSSLAEYINWLFKQYQEIKNAQGTETTYRLVDIEDKSGKCKLTIQVVGKAMAFTATPEEILSDDTLIEHFSSKDIRTITYYATKALQQPKQKIVIKRFCEKLNQIVFGVKHINKEEISEKTAAEISLDKKLLNNLSPEEAHMVGYTVAHNISNTEKHTIKKHKDQTK